MTIVPKLFIDTVAVRIQNISYIYRSHYRLNRRSLLSICGLSFLWLVILYSVRQSPREVVNILIVYGEIILAPVFGVLCTLYVFGDPCREILFSTLYRMKYVILGRYLVLASGLLLFWMGIILSGYLLQPESQLTFSKLLFGGGTAILFFGSVGLWSSLLLRSFISGGVIVTMLWALSLLFRETLSSHPITYLVYPFMTLQHPDSPDWLINRILLNFIAFILLMWSLQLANNEELLLPNESVYEE